MLPRYVFASNCQLTICYSSIHEVNVAVGQVLVMFVAFYKVIIMLSRNSITFERIFLILGIMRQSCRVERIDLNSLETTDEHL